MKSLFLFIFSLCCLSIFGQSGTKVFSNTSLHEVRIEFEDDEFWRTLTDNFEPFIFNPGSNEDTFALTKAKLKFDGQVIDSIGIRLKGFSSYFASNDLKKSFKIDFNNFVADRKFDGLRKLNLNNGLGDPSYQREFLCYGLMRQMGIAAPRVSFAKVFLNDTYWGVYTLVEQVDKSFLNDNFLDNDGDLYKNIDWSDMLYKGSSKELYPEFEKKTNSEEPWTDFIQLLKNINSQKSSFAADLEKTFDVDEYLNVLAVDIVTSNWDSYLEHGRNWYLYRDTTSKKFHWIPWDYNLAMGGSFKANNPLLPDQKNCLYKPYILYEKQTNGDYKIKLFKNGNTPIITSYEWTYDNAFYSNEKDFILKPDANGIVNAFLKVSVTYVDQAESCREEDERYIFQEKQEPWCPAFSKSSFTHNKNDAIVTETIAANFECCENWSTACENYYQSFEGKRIYNSVINFDVFQDNSQRVLNKKLMEVKRFKDNYTKSFCKIYNLFSVENLLPIALSNAELIRTSVEKDENSNFEFKNFKYDLLSGNGSCTIPSIEEFITIRKDQLTKQMQSLDLTCANSPVILANEVVINELVASNNIGSGIKDEKGEFEDWIELYNNTNTTKDLTGYFLSDDITKPSKWKFPDGTKISPNEYKIIWADEEKNDGPLHTNFKLSKSNETLYFSNGFSILDSITFSLNDNESYSRIPNGTGSFVVKSATYGFNNGQASNAEDEALVGNFTLKPNPATTNLVIEDTQDNLLGIDIINAAGQLQNANFEAYQSSISVDITNVSPGINFVKLRSKNGIKILKFVKI